MINFINFISTPSHLHHKNINRWYTISCTTLIMLFTSLAVVSIQQIQARKHLGQLHKEQLLLQKKANDLLEEHGKLSKEKASLLEKSESWEKYTHHAKKPNDLMNAIKQSTKEDTACRCLRTVRRSVHMQIQVTNAHEGTIITQNLSATQIFDEVTLCSFKQNQEGASIARIDGTLKKA